MLHFTAKTDTGLVRTTNQDFYACGNLPGDAVYMIVCDGMGGRNGGNIASEASTQIIKLAITRGYREDMSPNAIRDLMFCAIKAANAVVYEKSIQQEELSGMGTTAVVAIVNDGFAFIAHVGDSRAYHITIQDIKQITKDHTMVQLLIDTGKITEKEASKHPQKHLITRALGVDKQIDIDYSEVTFFEEDILLLCTDGLTNHLTSDDIYDVVNHINDYSKLPEILIDRVIDEGGSDNVTIAITY